MARSQAIESYDSVYMFMHIVGTVFFIIYAVDGFDKIVGLHFSRLPELFLTALKFAMVTCVAVYAHRIFRLTIWPEWIPKWAYINFSLKTRITIEEVQSLTFLFDSSINQSIFSLGDVEKLDKAERRSSIFRYANHMARINRREIPFPKISGVSGGSGAKSERDGDQPKSKSSKQGNEVTNSLMLLEIYVANPSAEDITKAYRRKIMQVHPDRNSSVSPEVRRHLEELSKQINKAYEYLKENYRP